jgi:sulfur-oxidizing protein SoxA
MKKNLLIINLLIMLGVPLSAALSPAQAGPEQDRQAFVKYFTERFPDTPYADFINGIYSIDKPSREQWEAIEEFPPYELALDQGKALFETPFANGKSYADCFANGGIGVRQDYPYFDTERGEVITLELAINDCRKTNGEKPLPYKKGDIAALSAYMAYTSRGNKLDIKIPDDPKALAAYESGKQFYYSKRGQLNFSCFDCHGGGSGLYVRADKLSPALGHPSHFPVYRSDWNELGTMHRRFGGCNEQVRAKAFPAQSPEYRNLEYFLTYMSNGLEVNGPGARK